MGEREGEADAVAADPAPALGEQPEHAEEPVLHARQVGDRLHREHAGDPALAALAERPRDDRPARRAGEHGGAEPGQARRGEHPPGDLAGDEGHLVGPLREQHVAGAEQLRARPPGDGHLAQEQAVEHEGADVLAVVQRPPAALGEPLGLGDERAAGERAVRAGQPRGEVGVLVEQVREQAGHAGRFAAVPARDRYDLVIVGMGTAGLLAAQLATTLGVRVAAVERGRLGGDCLWTGCVPSKSLLASAKAAQTMRHADRLGLEPVEPQVDVDRVLARVREVQARIAASDDDPERYRRMGVELLLGEQARVAGPHAVEVGGRILETRFVLVATGSVPVGPPIPGLREAGYLTSETIWDVERMPRSIVALGGGPISMELGQGLTRLGVPVTVLERDARVLPRDEPALVDRLVARLRGEGVDIRTGAEVERVEVAPDGRKVVHVGLRGQSPESHVAEEVVVGVGRVPQVEELGLEAVGVEVGPKGVVVDASLRTSVPSIYAAGDVAGRFQFTHSAGFEGARAVRNMFLPGRERGEYAVPWVTYTDPELAHSGLTSAQAREQHGERHVRVSERGLEHSDRARAEAAEEGALVLVEARGKLVGAHVLAPAGGEVVHELALAIDAGRSVRELGQLIHAYPTIATEVGMLGAGAAFAGARKLRPLARSRLGRVLARV